MVKRPLKIGSLSTGEPVSFSLELASQTMAVVGVRGSGKTVTVSVLVEELIKAAMPVVIIDPTNAWYGLKSSADGKSAGFAVIVLGGPQGDLPLTEGDGATIARFIVEHPGSFILSLRHLRKGAQRRFVTEFLEELYHLKGEPKYQTPLFVAIDEASQFVPQKVAGDTARMVGAVQDLVRLGRNSGFGVALIDARPASLNKDAMAGLELLIAHRITAPQDRKALLDWIRQNDSFGHEAEFLAQLARMKNGQAWFWAPAMDDLFEMVHVRMRETFDSSKTPKAGDRPVTPTVLAKVDLDALKGALAATLEEARENDPKELKKRIAELEAQLIDPPDYAPNEEAMKLAQQHAFDEGAREGYERGVSEARAQFIAEATERARGFNQRIADVAVALANAGDSLANAKTLLGVCRFEVDPPTDVRPLSSFTPEPGTLSFRIQETGGKAGVSEDVKVVGPFKFGPELPSGHQKIIDALARLDAVGIKEPTRAVLGAASGFSYKGGTFQKYVGNLSSSGLVSYPSDNRVRLTGAGQLRANRTKQRLTLRELHAAFLEMFDLGPRTILQHVINVYPQMISRKELGEITGYAHGGGTFQKYVGKLSSFGAVTYPDEGFVRASELLFPPGLR